ncbi:hypothetical protein KP509_23G056700 [Ceratopteris richardii]|uniref:Haloacid dehalogenase-like hydrolase domain-containing protein n=1 Tax=Ceratopteris richardii TaxID=49495 RepID=A0A8T2S2S1_CERRI|nr:hypothetical protein KP509_23G056700 [Ceratopteris richardii]
MAHVSIGSLEAIRHSCVSHSPVPFASSPLLVSKLRHRPVQRESKWGPIPHRRSTRTVSFSLEPEQERGNVEEEYSSTETEPKFAILMEVQGVVADLHRFGHRHSFNVAFQKLGLDCANWTEPVYTDLIRQAGGSEEEMLLRFFNRIGWPMALPTDQKGAFVQNLLREKQKALEDRVASGSLSLRPGVESFVDEVLDAGIPLIILAAYSKGGEDIARSLIQKLGPDRAKRISIVGAKEVEESAYGQVVLGAGSNMGLDEELAVEAAKAVAAEKQRMAEEVASLLKLSVEVDTTFSKSAKKAIALLRAGAEVAGVDAQNCILLAGGDTGVKAAERIGMPCIAVRSSLTSRAEFPAAIAVLDGFGSGSLTLQRLRRLV